MGNKHNCIFLDPYPIGGFNIGGGTWVVFFEQKCNACNHFEGYHIAFNDKGED